MLLLHSVICGSFFPWHHLEMEFKKWQMSRPYALAVSKENKWLKWNGNLWRTGWRDRMRLYVCKERESGSLKLRNKRGNVLQRKFFVWVFWGWSWCLGSYFVNYTHDEVWTTVVRTLSPCTTDGKQMCMFFQTKWQEVQSSYIIQGVIWVVIWVSLHLFQIIFFKCLSLPLRWKNGAVPP